MADQYGGQGDTGERATNVASSQSGTTHTAGLTLECTAAASSGHFRASFPARSTLAVLNAGAVVAVMCRASLPRREIEVPLVEINALPIKSLAASSVSAINVTYHR